MLSYSVAFYELLEQLKHIYDAQEAAAIAHEVLEDITGQNKLGRLKHKDDLLSEEQHKKYLSMKADLLTAKPLQYVLGYSWFMGKKFKVDNNVLIPRPETEELVQWIVNDHIGEQTVLEVLDIGTGSGCIPISLKLAVPAWRITSCDISKGALEVAGVNAKTLTAPIELKQFDFLDRREWQQLDMYDIIVSNPPYIPETEKEQLHANVKEHEPGTALFVPGNDAQLFYRTIAEFSKTHLKQYGSIYCELHVDHAKETEALFQKEGYSKTELRKDMHGNQRMIKASL